MKLWMPSSGRAFMGGLSVLCLLQHVVPLIGLSIVRDRARALLAPHVTSQTSKPNPRRIPTYVEAWLILACGTIGILLRIWGDRAFAALKEADPIGNLKVAEREFRWKWTPQRTKFTFLSPFLNIRLFNENRITENALRHDENVTKVCSKFHHRLEAIHSSLLVGEG